MAEKDKTTKGNTVALQTFLSYEIASDIGYKTFEKDGAQHVNFIWCKVCAKYKNEIQNTSKLRGQAKTSVKAFINGTNAVTKYQV